MDKLKPCPFCGSHNAKIFYDERQNYHVECYGCNKTVSYHITDQSSMAKAIEIYNRRLAPENKATELPRCDRCEHCTHAPSKKADGFTHYCDLSGRDVGQSHFGHNSPRVCPLRTHENQLLTVERLKQMDGDKICIHYIGHCTGFYEDEIAPYYGDKEQYIQRYNGMLRACDLPLKYYGIEWLAYARKPGQEEK